MAANGGRQGNTRAHCFFPLIFEPVPVALGHVFTVIQQVATLVAAFLMKSQFVGDTETNSGRDRELPILADGFQRIRVATGTDARLG